MSGRASAVAPAAKREDATASEGGGGDSIASPATEIALECRRERWHWRWSESLPAPPQAEVRPNAFGALPATDRLAKSAEGAWNIELHGGDLLNRPRFVAVSKKGPVFVCDHHADSKVKVFDADGSFLRYLGADFGVGEGQLDCPTAVAVDDENDVVFVTDATSNRIQGRHVKELLFDRHKEAAREREHRGHHGRACVYLIQHPRPASVHHGWCSRVVSRDNASQIERLTGLTKADEKPACIHSFRGDRRNLH